MKTFATAFAAAAHSDRAVGITKSMPRVTVETPSGPKVIERIHDPETCIQPITPADCVATIGEVELLKMLQDPETVVVDSRTPGWLRGGTIPGAIDIPYTVINDELVRLGCAADFDG